MISVTVPYVGGNYGASRDPWWGMEDDPIKPSAHGYTLKRAQLERQSLRQTVDKPETNRTCSSPVDMEWSASWTMRRCVSPGMVLYLMNAN